MKDESSYEVKNFIRRLKRWRLGPINAFEHSIRRTFTSNYWDKVGRNKIALLSSDVKKRAESDITAGQQYDNDPLLQGHKVAREKLYQAYTDHVDALVLYGDQRNWRTVVLEEEARHFNTLFQNLKQLYKKQSRDARRENKAAVNFDWQINHYKRNHKGPFREEYVFKVNAPKSITYLAKITVLVFCFLAGYYFIEPPVNYNLGGLFWFVIKCIPLFLLALFLPEKISASKVAIKFNYDNILLKWSGFLTNKAKIIPWDQVSFYSEEKKEREIQVRFHSEKQIISTLTIPIDPHTSLDQGYYDMMEDLRLRHLPPTAKHIRIKG